MSNERAHLEAEESLRVAERDRARRAHVILNDDLVKDALQALRDEAWRLFTDSKPGDVESLRLARLKYDAAEGFINALHSHVTTGKMAEEQLKTIWSRLNFIKKRAA
jgi:hypothetical protein